MNGPAKHMVDGSMSTNYGRKFRGSQKIVLPERISDAQDLKPRPNAAEHQGAVSRCSRAVVDGTSGGCANDCFKTESGSGHPSSSLTFLSSRFSPGQGSTAFLSSRTSKILDVPVPRMIE